MLLLVKYTLLYGIVLMLVALGGMFSEHSGIINIALEGIMVIGGLGGVLTVAMLQGTVPAWLLVVLSILVAALAGMVYALLLAFASINLKADQTIGGTALNMLATALAVILAKNYNGSTSSKVSYTNGAFLFKIGDLELSIFIPLGIVLLVISYIVMYKTRFGLRLRACGEHPQAADSVGINVYKMRYAGVLISGLLGGIGGMAYIIPSVQTWSFEVGVAGRHDLRPVEACAHLRCGHVLRRVQEPRQHCRCDLPRPAGLVVQHLQHDALHRLDGHSCVHEQEQHGTQGRRHPL